MIHGPGGLEWLTTQIKNALTVIAVGTGTEPVYADTQLDSELFRALITETTEEASTLFIEDLYLDESQGNGTLTTFAILGDGATANPATGKIFASVAPDTPLEKDNTQSLTISVEVEVVEVE